MKAKNLYDRLKNDFISSELSDIWAKYMVPVYDFLTENFNERSMGLVCDFAEEITMVYSAVFPTDEILKQIIDSGTTDAMLFLHHPSIWDIRTTPTFKQMNPELVKKLQEYRISIYNLHVPLDNYSDYSTSKTLADALDFEIVKPFARYRDINEIPGQITILKELLLKLGHKQLIVHPVCKSEPITGKTIHKLVVNMKTAVERLIPNDITVFIENNSKLDPIFTSPEELKVMFSCVPELELLLDVAHMDSIKHLKELVSVKMPKIIHIADRRLEEIHEHLPIGRGNIDFKKVFSEVLPGYEGKIVFEIIQSSNEILAAKKYFEDLLRSSVIGGCL